METADLEIVGKTRETLRTKGLVLSVAETFTAGLISYMLASPPGNYEFFDSAVICPSPRSMERLLGLDESFFKKHGLISEDAARAAAEAARERAGTGVALAVVGNPGPGEVQEMKPGLVFIAVSTEEQTTSRGFMYEGSPEDIRRSAAAQALHFLYEAVSVWA